MGTARPAAGVAGGIRARRPRPPYRRPQTRRRAPHRRFPPARAASPHPAMALALQLLPLLLSGAQGDPGSQPPQESQCERGQPGARAGRPGTGGVEGPGRGERRGAGGDGTASLRPGARPNRCPRPARPPPLVSLEGRPGDRVNFSCVGVSQPTRWAWAPSFPTCKGLSKGRRRILWASSSGTPTVSPVQPFAGRLRALDPGIRRLELLLRAGDSGTFICRGSHRDESRTVLRVLGDAAECRAPGPSQGRSKPRAQRP